MAKIVAMAVIILGGLVQLGQGEIRDMEFYAVILYLYVQYINRGSKVTSFGERFLHRRHSFLAGSHGFQYF